MMVLDIRTLRKNDMSDRLRDRLFKRAMFARRLRKAALHKHLGRQLSVKEYDQFCAKTRNIASLQKICDMSETGEWGEVVWDRDWWSWAMQNWGQIAEFIGKLDTVPENFPPNVAYDVAPRRRGRRHKLPSYRDDEDFIADREATQDRLFAAMKAHVDQLLMRPTVASS